MQVWGREGTGAQGWAEGAAHAVGVVGQGGAGHARPLRTAPCSTSATFSHASRTTGHMATWQLQGPGYGKGVQ